ncbi:MAG: hypothetical protein ACTHQ3_12820 [Motilibacteraceae bacterium]
MDKIAQTPAVIPADRVTTVSIPIDDELREALEGLTPAQLEEVRQAGQQSLITAAAEVRGAGHRPWCNLASHRRDLREQGADAEGCYSADVDLADGVGAWLVEGPDGVHVVIDGPWNLTLGAEDVLTLTRWLSGLDDVEELTAVHRLFEVVRQVAS